MRQSLQLLLDLFGPAPAPPASAGRPDSRRPIIEPVSFSHVRANRQARLAHAHVAYEFRRARRRHIGFTVGPEGLTVSAPKWVTLAEIDAALQKKADWIVRKLVEVRDRSQRQDAGRIDWKDGAFVPYLGGQLLVSLDPRHSFEGRGAVLRADGASSPAQACRTLQVGLSTQASADQIRDVVQAWLMREATRVFTERLDHYAPKLGVRWTRLSLSRAATRWGTAHSSGAIRLNWRLIHFRLSVIDYVVAHELSHLRVMDHSPRFWDTVGTVVPDYAELRSQLQAHPLPPW